METIIKYIWLTIKGISPRKLFKLLGEFPVVEEIYLCNNFGGIRFLNPKDKDLLMDKSLQRAEDIYHKCVEKGIRIITIEDENYPQILKEISSPPIVLYVKGKTLDLNNEFFVGIVGTRKSTSYGERVTAKFGTQLAQNDIIVVSGLALGIDSVAARAALKAEKPTIGVLGCGIDIVYPASNRELYMYVEKNGMLISEYPPGTPPATWTFPLRNRIIAGLSRGVIIVEGSRKSGSLITANFALEYNRDVFAVPRNIDDYNLDGTNHLIKQGAFPITCIDDLVEHYPELKNREKTVGGEYFINNNEQLEISTSTVNHEGTTINFSVMKRISPDEEKILNTIGVNKVHIDKLAIDTGIPINILSTKLTMLEIEGVIEQLAGKFYRIK